MAIVIIKKKTVGKKLQELAEKTFGDFVKVVVDIEKGIMGAGGELHSDIEAEMIKDGSLQKDLWGINIYPSKSADERIEFYSLINIRPLQGNRSCQIQDRELQAKIKNIVSRLVSF